MRWDQRIARSFRMSEETWKRHANPWSVWTRNTVLPLLVLAVWSRVWVGRWAIALTALAVLWAWLNPRVFPAPASTDNWASKAVLGERVWLQRAEVPLPPHHRVMPTLLGAIAAIGVVPLVIGVVRLDVWPTLFGAALIYCGKLWFLDRMVWLYEDMKDARPEYRAWLY